MGPRLGYLSPTTPIDTPTSFSVEPVPEQDEWTQSSKGIHREKDVLMTRADVFLLKPLEDRELVERKSQASILIASALSSSEEWASLCLGLLASASSLD